MSVDVVAEKLHSNTIGGLDRVVRVNVTGRLMANLLKRRVGSFVKYTLEQVVNPLVLLLGFACALSFFLKNNTDGWLILAAIIINGVVGFYQHFRADRAIDSLKKFLPVNAYVVRKGSLSRIPASELQTGDLVVLSTGSKVPADIRLAYVNNFSVDESILTGEADAVVKTDEANRRQDGRITYNNMIYAGSVVLRGEARGIVVATGADARFAHLLYGSGRFDKKSVSQIEKEVKFITKYVVIISILVVLIGIILMLSVKLGTLQALLYGISLFVAVVPEGLPAAVTIALALAAYRMSKKKMIIHNLPTADTLSNVELLLIDKTGTLTYGRHAVEEITVGMQTAQVKFSGNKLRTYGNEKPLNDMDMLKFTEVCHNSTTVKEYTHLGGVKYLGDPVDVALHQFSLGSKPSSKYSKIREILFESKNRFSATVASGKNGQAVFVKGAPEFIIKKSSTVLINGKNRKLNQKYVDDMNMEWKSMARRGLKVIMLAYSSATKKIRADGSNISDLTIVGIVGIRDKLREDAGRVMAYIRSHGIDTKIVSGDNSANVHAIARAINIKENGIIEGRQLGGILATRRFDVLENTRLFARMTPENKADLLRFYQKKGRSVAFVGDGVNDAMAIKLADVGIAVTAPHGDATADIADVALSGGDLRVFVSAIREGRKVWHSLRSVVFYLLTTNLSEILVILASFALSLPLPFTAVQILWINLLSDSIADESLIFGSGSGKGVKKTKIITRQTTTYILTVGLFNAVVVLALYLWGLSHLSQESARALSFVTLMSLQAFGLFAAKSLGRSVFNLRQYTTPIIVGFVFILGLAILSVQYMPLSRALGLGEISIQLLSIAIIIGLCSVAVFETLQLVYKKIVK